MLTIGRTRRRGPAYASSSADKQKNALGSKRIPANATAAPPTITTTTTTTARHGLGDERGEDEETTCPICFDSLIKSRPGGRLLRSSWTAERFWLDCGHAFCHSCLSTYAAISVEEGKTAAAVATSKGGALVCPVDGCTVKIMEATLKQLLSEEVR